MSIIVGNFCSLLALISDSISSSRKTARGVLLVQCVGQFFYCASSIILKGYSAAVQNAVSILRNLLASSKINSKVLEWLMIAIAVILGIIFNNLGFMGLLPIIANLEYSLAVFKFKNDEKKLKIAFLICILMYAIFNIIILNFVGVISNIVVAVITLMFLIKGSENNENTILDDNDNKKL